MIPILSIRQPWAWLILNAGKDIENRDWPTDVRGRILIHASKGMTRAEFDDAADFLDRVSPSPFANALLSRRHAMRTDVERTRGGIVGSVEIVDCVARSASPWFFGEYGFVLRDPKPLPFHPMKGQLGFFQRANSPRP